jgi:two-component system nitrate/nitrite response regulator NarL
MSPTPVYLVGGSNLFRQGLRVYLENTPFDVVRDLPNAEAAHKHTQGEVPPELLLFALSNGQDDYEAEIRTLRDAFQDVPTVAIAEQLSLEEVTRCLAAGVRGFLLSDISTEALSYSLQLVLLGETVFPTKMATFWMRPNKTRVSPASKAIADSLSARENDILRCLVGGNSNKAIARQLEITESTVKVHMKSLLRKINATNRTQAAIWGMEAGFGGSGQVTEVEHD